MLAMILRDQGVSLAVNDDTLTVETTTPLTYKQRIFIREHEPQLMAELKTGAANNEVSVVVRLEQITRERNHPLNDLLRWYKDDLPDLAAMSDKDFKSVVGEYLDNLGRYSPAKRPHCVKCIDCKYFTRSDHPHLGKCSTGVKSSAVAGFWDTHLRGCSKFIGTTGEMKCDAAQPAITVKSAPRCRSKMLRGPFAGHGGKSIGPCHVRLSVMH